MSAPAVVVSPQMVDDADDLLLDTVASFIEAHGGLPDIVGGVELIPISERKFCVCVHVEGVPPPPPGAPTNG